MPCARVVLLAGPSGSGKSRLAERSGLPRLQLDDFYRDGDESGLPRLPGGAIDWDDPRSWNRDAALAAIESLCAAGRADVPVYSISASRVEGSQVIGLDGAGMFVAEGIFVAELIEPCRSRDLLQEAICVRRPRVVNFWHRLRRDLAERRKPPLFLVRRGLLLARREASIAADLRARGCVCLSPSEARSYLAGSRSTAG